VCVCVMFVHVCVCTCLCVYECVRVCVCACMLVYVGMCVCVCMRVHAFRSETMLDSAGKIGLFYSDIGFFFAEIQGTSVDSLSCYRVHR